MTTQLKLPEYIKEAQSQQRSRYEIDLALLSQGYGPQEIEAAWADLAKRSSARFGFLRVILAKLASRPDWWVLFGVLVLVLLPNFLVNIWPFPLYYSSMDWIEIVAALLIGISLVNWGNKRRKAGLKRRFTLIFAVAILIVASCFYGLGVLFNGDLTTREIASAKSSGYNYHLTYTTGCSIECGPVLTIYQCDNFNLNCDDLTYFSFYTSTLSDVSNWHLQLNPDGRSGQILNASNEQVKAFSFP